MIEAKGQLIPPSIIDEKFGPEVIFVASACDLRNNFRHFLIQAFPVFPHSIQSCYLWEFRVLHRCVKWFHCFCLLRICSFLFIAAGVDLYFGLSA